MNGDVNVIVADGFTGNVALKTAEGTANFMTGELKKALGGTIIGKISSLLNFSNLQTRILKNIQKQKFIIMLLTK